MIQFWVNAQLPDVDSYRITPIRPMMKNNLILVEWFQPIRSHLTAIQSGAISSGNCQRPAIDSLPYLESGEKQLLIVITPNLPT